LMFQAAILIDMHRRSPRLGEYPPPHGTLKLPALDLERPDNSLFGRYELDLSRTPPAIDYDLRILTPTGDTAPAVPASPASDA